MPDNKRLRDFTKIPLEPGETKTVTFQLPAKALAFVGADGKWTLEEGDFLLKVGNLNNPLMPGTVEKSVGHVIEELANYGRED